MLALFPLGCVSMTLCVCARVRKSYDYIEEATSNVTDSRLVCLLIVFLEESKGKKDVAVCRILSISSNATKTCWGSGDIAPRILNLGTMWR